MKKIRFKNKKEIEVKRYLDIYERSKIEGKKVCMERRNVRERGGRPLF
jgi:hypothetical protein